jgi:hypothetical protein
MGRAGFTAPAVMAVTHIRMSRGLRLRLKDLKLASERQVRLKQVMRTSLSNPLRAPSLAVTGYSQKNRGSFPCSRHLRQEPGELAWPKIKNRTTLSGNPAVWAGAKPFLFRPHLAMGIRILLMSYIRKSSIQMSREKLYIHHTSLKKIQFNSTITPWKSVLLEESVARACLRLDPPKARQAGAQIKNPAPGEGAGPDCYP